MNLPPDAREAFHHYSRGDFQRAEPAARKALVLAPNDENLRQLLAAILVGLNRPAEAIDILERIARRGSATGDLSYNLGTALAAAGRHADAVAWLRKACAAKPQDPHCHNNLGLALHATLQHREAILAFDRALKLVPDWPVALYHRATAGAALGNHLEAVDTYTRIMRRTNNSVPAEVPFSLGFSLHQLGRSSEALAAYSRALAINPRFAACYNDQGSVLLVLKRYAAALDSYERAIALKPDYSEALANRGTALTNLKRPAEAIASFDRALAIKPLYAEAHHGRGIALAHLNRHDDALQSFDRALAIAPGNADFAYSRGNSLKELGRLQEAIDSYQRAVAIKPDHSLALSACAYLALCACDWKVLEKVRGPLFESCRLPTFSGTCFPILAMSDDPILQASAARNYMGNAVAPVHDTSPRKWGPRQRLRIGYLSADFGRHPTSYLIAELIEVHDRQHFEIYGFSARPDDGSEMRRRLQSAFDVFVDVHAMSDSQLADAVREARIDILVDLGGHTHGGRILALASRPAPIQATYLGYPGTVGATFIDYAIVDKIVAPAGSERHFTEKLIYLPNTYQVNDRKRAVSERPFSRAECGLPDASFIFCCFNHVNKINATVFDAWMDILKGAPRSALWLLHDSDLATRNLRYEAATRGVDPDRLIFAPKLALPDHLARMRQADLFLDTWPYNAHTTASDALWVGLPLLTLAGSTFAARVAASLLQASGIPDLVTSTSEEYVALALKLAASPSAISQLTERLKAGRDTNPLFDSQKFANHIEAAYRQMWRLFETPQHPAHFSVEP